MGAASSRRPSSAPSALGLLLVSLERAHGHLGGHPWLILSILSPLAERALAGFCF